MRLATVAIAVAVAAGPARAGEVVRIAVAVAARRVTLAGSDLAMTPLRDGAAAERLRSRRAEVRLERDSLFLDGAAIDAPGAVFSSSGGIETAGMLLRGDVEVRRTDGGLAVVHVLPLEDYVAAVTGSEMPPDFPPEALKAQAVAARTFAVFKKLEAVAEGRPWHLGATVLDQVYRGSRIDARVRAAAGATAGEVLVHDHAPIEAYFHSTCGGTTERGADALGRDLPYLQSVRCDRCRASPRWRWTVRVGADELGRVVGLGRAVTAVTVDARTASGRAQRLTFAAAGRHVAIGGADLRQRLGFDRLPSLSFAVRREGGSIVFDGHGAGHGAGLCQWGAAGAARAGDSYRTILARYYPGSELVRMY